MIPHQGKFVMDLLWLLIKSPLGQSWKVKPYTAITAAFDPQIASSAET